MSARQGNAHARQEHGAYMDGWMDGKTDGQRGNWDPTHRLQDSRAEMDTCTDRWTDRQVNRQTGSKRGSDNWTDRQEGQGCLAGRDPTTHGCSPGVRSRSCPGHSGHSAGRGRGACTHTALPAPGTRCCGSPGGRTGRLRAAGPVWGQGCSTHTLPALCHRSPAQPCCGHGFILSRCTG